MNDMLIQEVNDALRKERAEQFWVKNRGGLLALVVAVIVGTAGGQIYRSWKQDRNEAFATAIVEVQGQIETGRFAQANLALETLAKDYSGEQQQIARLWLARAQIAEGKAEAAETTLEALIESKGNPTSWKDAACVWHAGLTSTWHKACDALQDSPLQTVKLELAAATAIAKKDWDAARPLVKKLQELSEELPEQRVRAGQLALLLPPVSEPPRAEKKSD